MNNTEIDGCAAPIDNTHMCIIYAASMCTKISRLIRLDRYLICLGRCKLMPDLSSIQPQEIGIHIFDCAS